MELQKEKTQIIKKAVANIQIKMEISSMVLENKIKVMVKILPMDHYLKKRDQDHQRENFLDKMEKVKVKILLMDHNLKEKDQDHQRANYLDKIEKVKVKILDLKEIKIKMESQIQNLTVKMAKIQNPINKMAINLQKNYLQTETV